MRCTSSQRIMWGKVLKLLLNFFTYVTLNLALSVLGPSLPDLQLVLHSSLASVSSVFLCMTVSGVVACVSAPLLDRALGSNLVFVFTTGGLAAIQAAAPFTPNLYCFLGLFFCIAFLCITNLTIIQASTSRIQEKPALALRFVNFGGSLGWVFGPLMVSPFVSPSHCFQGREHNGTRTGGLNSTGEEAEGGECGGRIYLAFLILASLCGLAFVGAVVVLVVEGRGRVPLPTVTIPREEKVLDSASKSRRALFLVSATFYHVATKGIIFLPGIWLVVYGLNSSLGLELGTLSALDGGFYASIAVGSVLIMAVYLCVGQKTVMGGCLLGMLGASLVVLLLGEKDPHAFAAGIVTFGFLSAPHYNGVTVLVSEVMELSTSVASLITGTSILSFDLMTYLCGVMLRNLGYWLYLWVPLFSNLVALFAFGTTVWIMRTSSRPLGDEYIQLPVDSDGSDEKRSSNDGGSVNDDVPEFCCMGHHCEELLPLKN